jgi:hypothetical protein
VQRELSPRLTSDKLTIVFISDRGGSGYRIYEATRDSATELFGPSREVVPGDTEQWHPWISDDALTLLFSDGTGIQLATRMAASDNFVVQGQVVAGQHAYVVGGANGTLYYTTAESPTVAGRLVQTALDDWAPTGRSIEHLETERFVVSSDQLTAFPNLPNGDGGPRAIWRSERTSAEQAFSDLVLWDLVSSELNMGPGWISPDQCEFYFDRARATDDLHDLYVVTREP